MSEFKFQFQYDPSDLKAIRDATGKVTYSPATTISVWAAGLAVALLILGANGMWIALLICVTVATVFGVLHVSHLRRKSLSNREYRVRTMTLTGDSLVEEFGGSMFEKSWAAFDEFRETSEHFLFRHYEKITALPKRAVALEQIEDCRNFIASRIDGVGPQRLPRFDEWFLSKDLQIFRFHWRPDDIKRLETARMQRFGGIERAAGERSVSVKRLFIMIFACGAIGLATLYLGQVLSTDNEFGVLKILSFLVAIFIPFLVAYTWWRFTNFKSSSSSPRIPTEEISIALHETNLIVGYPKAVARYHWQDISAFYFNNEFIGFQPVGGMVHVIASRAFGGYEGAKEFLKTAERLKNESSPLSEQTVANSDSIETGNPFQSPITMQ